MVGIPPSSFDIPSDSPLSHLLSLHLKDVVDWQPGEELMIAVREAQRPLQTAGKDVPGKLT